MADTSGTPFLISWFPEVPGGGSLPAPWLLIAVALGDTEVLPVPREDFRHIAAANPVLLEEVGRIVSSRRGKLVETIRETEEAAAARAADHRDLLERVRAFFGV